MAELKSLSYEHVDRIERPMSLSSPDDTPTFQWAKDIGKYLVKSVSFTFGDRNGNLWSSTDYKNFAVCKTCFKSPLDDLDKPRLCCGSNKFEYRIAQV
jgi:hypothetical protein